MMQIRPFILAAAVVAAGLTTMTAVSPAFAGARDRSVTVATDDLNLASPAGRATLDNRIENAARVVCGTALTTELDYAATVAACRADVLAAAHAQRDAILGGESYAELRVGRSVRAAN
jgi:UrcA family protein